MKLRRHMPLQLARSERSVLPYKVNMLPWCSRDVHACQALAASSVPSPNLESMESVILPRMAPHQLLGHSFRVNSHDGLQKCARCPQDFHTNLSNSEALPH
eukprot:2228144-Pleurochrysis_carterae.AAC.1